MSESRTPVESDKNGLFLYPKCAEDPQVDLMLLFPLKGKEKIVKSEVRNFLNVKPSTPVLSTKVS